MKSGSKRLKRGLKLKIINKWQNGKEITIEMNSIDLLRTLTDDELIAFIILMSEDENSIETWTFNVLRAKKCIIKIQNKEHTFIGKTLEYWKRSLLNEANDEEQEIYKGNLEL